MISSSQKKTKFAAQLNECKNCLNKKSDEIIIHALGNAINRALNLALVLEDSMRGSLQISVVTGSVKVTDDIIASLDDDIESTQRVVSAVHILVARI